MPTSVDATMPFVHFIDRFKERIGLNAQRSNEDDVDTQATAAALEACLTNYNGPELAQHATRESQYDSVLKPVLLAMLAEVCKLVSAGGLATALELDALRLVLENPIGRETAHDGAVIEAVALLEEVVGRGLTPAYLSDATLRCAMEASYRLLRGDVLDKISLLLDKEKAGATLSWDRLKTLQMAGETTNKTGRVSLSELRTKMQAEKKPDAQRNRSWELLKNPKKTRRQERAAGASASASSSAAASVATTASNTGARRRIAF